MEFQKMTIKELKTLLKQFRSVSVGVSDLILIDYIEELIEQKRAKK